MRMETESAQPFWIGGVRHGLDGERPRLTRELSKRGLAGVATIRATDGEAVISVTSRSATAWNTSSGFP